MMLCVSIVGKRTVQDRDCEQCLLKNQFTMRLNIVHEHARRYGFGSWDKIRNDEELGLTDKIASTGASSSTAEKEKGEEGGSG